MHTRRIFGSTPIFLLLLGSVPCWSQPPELTSNDVTKECRRALSEASAAIASMPEGDEKAAAVKEFAAATNGMANGDAVSCNAHALSAREAAGTKTPS